VIPERSALFWAHALHRLAASSAGILLVLIVFVGWDALQGAAARLAAIATLALAGFLAWLGLITPSILPAVTVGNLLGGMTMIALLWWLHQRARGSGAGRTLHGLALAALVLQIALGGMIGARHAVLSCVTLPACTGGWWPDSIDWRLFDPFFVLPESDIGSAAGEALILFPPLRRGAGGDNPLRPGGQGRPARRSRRRQRLVAARHVGAATAAGRGHGACEFPIAAGTAAQPVRGTSARRDRRSSLAEFRNPRGRMKIVRCPRTPGQAVAGVEQHPGAATTPFDTGRLAGLTKALMNLPSICGARASTSMPCPARNCRAVLDGVDPRGLDFDLLESRLRQLARVFGIAQGARDAADPQLDVPSNLAGTLPFTTTSETANRPPGFSTRKASRSTRSLSADRLITQLEMMTSTELSGAGRSRSRP